MPSNVRTFLTAALAGFGLLLTGCGSPAASTPSADAGGRIAVVTSTNVYGDIVEAIGGDKVNVAAIISRPSQDPHSYEANAQDRLTVSKAKLVVENGGGYDDFIHTLADDSNVPHENIISAVEVSGLAPEAAGTASAHAEPTQRTGTPMTTATSTSTSGTALTPCRTLPMQWRPGSARSTRPRPPSSPPMQPRSSQDSPSLRVRFPQ